MFCTNCGKEIIDTARFCNFCGTPIQNMAASIPVQPVQPVQQAQTEQPGYSQPVQTAPGYSESADITEENISENIPGDLTEIADTASVYEAESEEAAETADDASVPTPNTIPTYGASDPIYSAPPAYPTPAQTVNTIPVQSAELAPESKPERRYTLGHIMMCLAAVAVMAIVAGVFAGLYFSVV